MENITMTTTAQPSRVPFACPQIANRVPVAGGVGSFQEIGASAFAIGGVDVQGPVAHIVTDPAYLTHTPKNTKNTHDVAYFRSGRPPV